MFRIDTWQEIFFTIQKNKLRTFLTAMGVFWGILILMLLLGSGRGMENGILSMYGNRVINSIYLWSVPTTMPFEGKDIGRKIELTMEDSDLVEHKFKKEIQHLAPRLGIGKKVLVKGKATGAFTVRGEIPSFFDIEPLTVLEGRLINNLDVEQKRKVIVIGKHLQEVFFKNEKAIGNFILMGGTEFQVVGVCKSKSSDGSSGKDKQAFIPLSTAQRMSGNTQKIDQLICALHPNFSAKKVEKKMKSFLKERHHVHPKDRQGIRTKNMAKEFKQFQGLFSAVNIFVWFVGLGTLFAGIVSVGNIMLITVKERIKEIGIRKAMGATPGSIVFSVLMESVFITTISGYIGLLAGAGTIYIVSFVLDTFKLNSRFFANPEIDFGMGLKALLILVVAGLFAGLIPAIKASMVNPVVALRND